jgi:hypothetical protein
MVDSRHGIASRVARQAGAPGRLDALTWLACQTNTYSISSFRLADTHSGSGKAREYETVCSRHPMKADGQNFLDQLASSSSTAFEKRFAQISTRLGLAGRLDANELGLLCEAAFYATLCNIAFNGVGGCVGGIRPEREPDRIRLEREFMAASDRFFASAGWKSLTGSEKGSIQRIFLNVFVVEDNVRG